jgi:hypothetical protein
METEPVVHHRTRSHKSDLDAVNIGKGLTRVIVRSRSKRAKIVAVVHEIIIDGDRVIFPASLFGAVMASLKKGKRKGKSMQITMNLEEE